MIRTFNGLAIGLVLTGSTAAWAANAARVVSYTPGTSTIGAFNSYLNPDRALGEADRIVGVFGGTPSLVTPYNGPFSPDDLVFIGSGGQITLELDHYATPITGATEIGIFTSQFINQSAPSSASGDTLLFNGDQAGIIRVSEDGQNWVTLGGGALIDLNTPTTGYVFPDAIPTWSSGNPADYDESHYTTPFTGTLDFNSLDAFEQARAAAYGTTAGGNWLDLSGLGLSRIGYLQIERPGTADQAVAIRLDAIYLSGDAVGAVIPEPATLALLAIGGVGALLRRRTN